MKSANKYKRNLIWILVYTKVKEEQKAKDNLKKQGFKTFLPLISPTNKSRKLRSPVPVFPRYLFVQIDLALSNWTSINSSYGVSSIVMFSEKFTSISNDIIEAMQKKLDESGTYKENISVIEYQKGDKVSIKKGRFAGVDAIFLSKKSKDRVMLLLSLLNTKVSTELNESNIGRKEVIKSFKF